MTPSPSGGASSIPLNNSTMSALRAATASSHRRLEKRLSVTERFGKLTGYREHLERMWGFCSALEASLGAQSFEGALPDYEARRKLPLLATDLAALGLSGSSISSLPRCREMPEPSGPAFALGCVYVLEGATLGGRTLLPLVEERLGFNADHGASYLASYGTDVAAMWRAFKAAVEACCCDADRQASALRAAVLTFDVLADWLCGNEK
ncbi:MAG: biliverdin-producing heme oxygenase [Pseudomonadota bacterium]|nr:biliverdin-producing heme oxygenase [Pseudomonadota bacterium]